MSEVEDILVEATNVSKKFSKNLKRSLYYGISDIATTLLGIKTNRLQLRKDEFWSVKNISFQLKRGECLGLIGHNGAGKSTLLKILNGLIKPDEGHIVMRGKIGALIELGAGFNPVLTGRENIYINGQILGFTKKEIDEKLEAIINFSEIREFIDSPVQNYSSGMKVRLGFAVAAQMNPDVLIIDEVLAVGDLGFILKCFKRIDEILPRTAVIFVSHNMPQVSRICNEIILMDKGIAKYQGSDVAKGIDLYYTKFAQHGSSVLFSDGSIELIEAIINDCLPNNKEIAQIPWGSDLKIALKLKNNNLLKIPYISITIFDKEQRGVAVIDLQEFDISAHEEISVEIGHKNLQLSKGIYSMNISVSKAPGVEPILRINGIGSFQVLHQRETWPPFLLKGNIEIKN